MKIRIVERLYSFSKKRNISDIIKMNYLRNYIPLTNLAQAINPMTIHLLVYNVKNSGNSTRISWGCQKSKFSYHEITFSKKSYTLILYFCLTSIHTQKKGFLLNFSKHLKWIFASKQPDYSEVVSMSLLMPFPHPRDATKMQPTLRQSVAHSPAVDGQENCDPEVQSNKYLLGENNKLGIAILSLGLWRLRKKPKTVWWSVLMLLFSCFFKKSCFILNKISYGLC